MTRVADLPLIYDLLCDTSNLAADELLVSSVGELEPEYQRHALETLLKRQQPVALRQLVEQYHDLPDPCRQQMGEQIALLEGVFREVIRSTSEQDRSNVIDLIAGCACYSMSYLLSMGLRSGSSETRAQAASALRKLTAQLTDKKSSSSPQPDQLLDARSYYQHLADLGGHRKMMHTALRDALRAYETHLRTTVVEATAMMSLDLESEVRTEAQKPQSKYWRAVLDMLRFRPEPLFAPLALQALGIEQTRVRFAELITKCPDNEFMLAVANRSWLMGDPGIRKGCKLIRRLQWLEENEETLLAMSADDFQQTSRFIESTGIPDMKKIEWYRLVLLSDHRDKHATAVWGIIAINNDRSSDLLRTVTDWGEPHLARISLRALRAREGGCTVGSAAQYRARSKVSDARGAEGSGRCSDFDEYWANYDQISESRRLTLGRSLLASDHKFEPSLSEKLSSASGTDRALAVHVIRTLQLTKRFRAQILERALDPDHFVRSAAIKALPQLQSAAARRVLSSALEDSDRRVRANAIEALDELRPADRVEKITPSLADGDHRIRAAAIKSLLKLQVREAAEALLQMLKDPSRAHRISALWVVDKYGLATIVNQISSMADEDPDEVVRKRAQRLLRAEKRKRKNRDAPIPAPKEGRQV